jgi:hypothetical protein
VDLSRHREKLLAMRWRTEVEVLEGKGADASQNGLSSAQDSLCVAVCTAPSGRASPAGRSAARRAHTPHAQVDFNYVERDTPRAALVKVRLCPACTVKYGPALLPLLLKCAG